ncbi:unnamed protein product [Phytophthora lilii]|uniref:Unnamed protein product n=1 Tax=Phytophthora lilii TaxID=2077276 RepID=A0A9W6TPU9_9STRA|nr:unnamed protein product [Phytophthora lilii]
MSSTTALASWKSVLHLNRDRRIFLYSASRSGHQQPSIRADPFRTCSFRRLARVLTPGKPARFTIYTATALALKCWMSAPSASRSLDAVVESAQSWFVDNILDDEIQLFGGPNEALKALDSNLQICGGLPLLVTRSSTMEPNGACPDIFTVMNASCTCLTGLDNNDDAWEFHVKANNGDSNTTSYPTTLAATELLVIDAIQTLYVPESLEKL